MEKSDYLGTKTAPHIDFGRVFNVCTGVLWLIAGVRELPVANFRFPSRWLIRKKKKTLSANERMPIQVDGVPMPNHPLCLRLAAQTNGVLSLHPPLLSLIDHTSAHGAVTNFVCELKFLQDLFGWGPGIFFHHTQNCMVHARWHFFAVVPG